MSVQCGTYGGYQKHHRDGEEPCEPCREASRAYSRRYRARFGGSAPADRAFARAQNEASKWVRAHHPDVWQRLLKEAHGRDA